MKKNICQHMDTDGLTCLHPKKLNTKCCGKCDDFLDDLEDLYIENVPKRNLPDKR